MTIHDTQPPSLNASNANEQMAVRSKSQLIGSTGWLGITGFDSLAGSCSAHISPWGACLG